MADGDRYFLRVGPAPWAEVTEQQWRDQERACGFRSTGGFSTGGFSAHGVQGRIYCSTESIPPDVLPPEPEKVEYRWFTRIAAHEHEGRRYDEETYSVSPEVAALARRSPEELARTRAASWRSAAGPEVKVDVLRQKVVTYPKEIVDD